jgi:hypothetical protein
MKVNRHPLPTQRTPAGTSASVTIYDDGQYNGTTKVFADTNAVGKTDTAVVVTCLVDQASELVISWEPRTTPSASSALTRINGADGTRVIAANTFYRKVVTLNPGHNKIEFKTGSPAPTATYITAEVVTFPGTIS